jgi:predicted metalloprotease
MGADMGRIRLPAGRGARRWLGGGIGVIILALIAMFFGVDPSFLLQGFGDQGGVVQERAPTGQPGADDPTGQFVSAVLGETEAAWSQIFQERGETYREPVLVLFDGAVQSACGFASAAAGPFYCPGDRKVYLDTSFFRDLEARFGAAGDFAQAYVIAHEVGHHVQNLIGIAGKVSAARQRLSEAEGNQLSVRLELQADCFAGVWANHVDDRQLLEEGDLEEALGAAAAIGDDRLQRRAQGYVVPESFTHGSSEQRARWFVNGLRAGSIDACDTFSDARV